MDEDVTGRAYLVLVVLMVIVGSLVLGLLLPDDGTATRTLAVDVLTITTLAIIMVIGVSLITDRWGTDEQRADWEANGPRIVGGTIAFISVGVALATWLWWPGRDYGFLTALALVMTAYGWAFLVMMWWANRMPERDD